MVLHPLLWMTLVVAGWAWFGAALAAPAFLCSYRPGHLLRSALCVITALGFWVEFLFALNRSSRTTWHERIFYGSIGPALLLSLPIFAVTLLSPPPPSKNERT